MERFVLDVARYGERCVFTTLAEAQAAVRKMDWGRRVCLYVLGRDIVDADGKVGYVEKVRDDSD